MTISRQTKEMIQSILVLGIIFGCIGFGVFSACQSVFRPYQLVCLDKAGHTVYDGKAHKMHQGPNEVSFRDEQDRYRTITNATCSSVTL